jgi:AraC-like DNA-binding protein
MVGIIYRTFDEPGDYERGIRLARVGDLVVSKSGVFEASLTTMTFGRVWLQSGSDSIARSLRIEIEDSRRTMLFLTDWHSVPIIQSGADFGVRDVVSFGQNTSHFQRSFGPTDWTAISLPPGDLEAAVRGFLGSDIVDPSGSLWGKPAVEHLTRLRGLRYELSRLISSGEKTLQNPEAVRSLEQTLTAAMVACLTNRIESNRAPGWLRHQQIMRRFGDWLNANSDRAVYIREVCTAVDVSAATLRRCCEEHLRMSPMQYLWLRRMNLVRRELQQQNLRTTVTTTAMNFGFWHLGRFADEYRSLFGESPSSTLARRPA